MEIKEQTPVEIVEARLDAIRPYERNPRKNEKAVPAVAASIKAFGFQAPILVDGDGVILAGHTRYLAAKKLGMETAPVTYIRNLTPVEARAYRLADNRVGAGTAWNIGRLRQELKAIEGKFKMERFGFKKNELKAFLDEFRVDLMRESREEGTPGTAVRPGETWKLGQHILVCGEGIDGRTNTAALGGELAAACITRPYFADRERTERLMRQALVQTAGAAYFHVRPPFLSWAKPAWENAGGIWSTFIINRGGTEGGPVVPHEFSAYIYGWNRARGRYFIGDRGKVDVWEFGDTEQAAGRLRFAGEAMANSSIPEQMIFDPCAGEGDTLIAAEMGCRRAVCVESDPELCGRIIDRWESFTHRKAARADG